MRLVAGRAGAVVALMVGLGGSAYADKADKERADALFEDGRKYLEKKEYALACTAFEQSHEADPAIGTQLNIALCYEDWGKVASAYRAYLEAERLSKEKKDKRAKGARTKIDQLAPKVPHLILDLPPGADPSLVLLFDGKELDVKALADDLLIDAGKHELEVRVPGKPPSKQDIDIDNGERKKLTIQLPEAGPVVINTPPGVVMVRNKTKMYAGIGLTAGGALTLGISSLVALAARQDYNAAAINCPMAMCRTQQAYDDTQSARSRANLMTWFGVAGIAMVGAGVYLIVTSGGKRTESKPISVSPIVTGDGVGLSFGGAL